MTPTVLLYVRPDCPHCDALRAALAARGAAVTAIDVAKQKARVPELLKLTGGRRIVPVMVENGVVTVAPHGGTTF